MRVLGILCGCRLCKGGPAYWRPCGCRVGDYCPHSPTHIEVNGELFPVDRVVNTGGRRAMWILLEGDEEYAFLSARERGLSFEELGWKDVEEVCRLPASVHSCWKIQCHQELVIYRPMSAAHHNQ